MTKGPKGVTQKHNRLPARPPHADPLQVYCPDLEQWARSWSYEPRDIPPGLQMVEYFKPFLRHLLTLDLSRQTLRRHRSNLGSGWRDHPPVADGQRPPETARRAGRWRSHRRRGNPLLFTAGQIEQTPFVRAMPVSATLATPSRSSLFAVLQLTTNEADHTGGTRRSPATRFAISLQPQQVTADAGTTGEAREA